MEQLKEFELNKKRELGEIITDGIEFIKHNLGQIFAGYIYYVLPWMLLAIAFIYIFFDGQLMNINRLTENSIGADVWASLFVYYFLFMIAYMVAYAVIFSIFLNTDDSYNDGNVDTISISGIAIKLFSFYVITFGLLFFLFGMVAFLLMQISPFLLAIFSLLISVGMIYIMVPLSIAPYIYVRENLGVSGTIRRTLDITQGFWWNTFFVILLAGLISMMVSYLFLIPIYVIAFAFGFSLLDVTSGAIQGWFGSLVVVVSSLVSLLVNMYTITCIVLKYYDLVEQKEGTRLKSKISEIGNQKDTLFENEGEY